MADTRLLCWTALSLEQATLLLAATSKDDVLNKLREILDLHENNSQSGILLDMYYHLIQFCRASKFEYDKTSVAFAILKKVHEAAISTGFDNMDAVYEVRPLCMGAVLSRL